MRRRMSNLALWLYACGPLLGWLSLHAALRPLVHRRVNQLRSLVASLKSDERYAAPALASIDDAVSEVRVGAMAVIFPILIPITLFILFFRGLRARLSGRQLLSPGEAFELMRFREHEQRLRCDTAQARGTVREDPRFRRLDELAFEIEAMRWPLASLLTVIVSIPALLLFLALYGRRETSLILLQLGLFFARALAELPTTDQRRHRIGR